MHYSQKLVVLIGLILISDSALAYLDPGSMSLILQGLLAGIIGIGATFRMWGSKLTVFFRREDIKSANRANDATEEEEKMEDAGKK